MKSKIALIFDKCRKAKRPALITYTVAGDNTKNNSLKILNKISKHADILELGFPHNTPIADGGQIQGSSHRALENGIKLKDVFQIVKKFKKNNPSKPVILMGYFNLIYQNGENRFLKSCKIGYLAYNHSITILTRDQDKIILNHLFCFSLLFVRALVFSD